MELDTETIKGLTETINGLIGLGDTAIKIGLGALISGVSTYILTNKNHKNDLNRKFREKRIAVLEYSTENFEPRFHALSQFFSYIDGRLRTGVPPGGMSKDLRSSDFLLKQDEALMETREKTSIAISRMKLCGIQKVPKLLNDMQDIENDFRDKVLFEDILPTKDELAGFKDRFKVKQEEIYVELQREFNEIYS